jgi:hypothetical protein
VIVDAVDQVVAWLGDGTNGVNAVRTAIPGGVTVPAVTVYDQNTHAWVAQGTIERAEITTSAALLVDVVSPVRYPGKSERWIPYPEVPVRVRYLLRGGDTNTAEKYGLQTLRACVRAVVVAFNSTAFATEVIRNGVVFNAPDCTIERDITPVGEDVMVGALTIALPCLDAWSLGRAT